MSGNELENVVQALRELHEHHKQSIDAIYTRVDKSFEINKQLTAFFERLLLLDLGTIALSVNALIALMPKLPSPQLHKAFFAGFLIASWVCLLVSASFCRSVMLNVIKRNARLAAHAAKRAEQYLANVTLADIGKLSRAASSAQGVPLKTGDGLMTIEELFTKAQQNVSDLNNQNIQSILQDPLEKRHRLLRPRSLAIAFMYFGLISLCIVAIRMVLVF